MYENLVTQHGDTRTVELWHATLNTQIKHRYILKIPRNTSGWLLLVAVNLLVVENVFKK